MNRVGARTSGYTIVETMIFLAVSALMLLSAMFFMSGQQRKNEFATGIRDIQSQLADIMNDTSTGFYSSATTFTCSVPPADLPPIASSGSSPQGTNAPCTFVGRAIQFASDGNNQQATVYTLIGRRQTPGPGATDVRNIYQAKPIILNQADPKLVLPYGINIAKITYNGSSIAGSIAFVTHYAGNAGSGGITGTQDIDLIPIVGSALLSSTATGKNEINAYLISNSILTNPPTGINLCFNSGGTNQHADILIGGKDRQLSNTLTISEGMCPA